MKTSRMLFFVLSLSTFAFYLFITIDSADSNEVQRDNIIIGPNAVFIPLNRILMVKKDSHFCAIRFTDFWTGETEQDKFARYEAYYKKNMTGKLSDSTYKLEKGELSMPMPRGIGRFAFSFGKKEIKCGSIKLSWFGEGWILFYRLPNKEGDYGIQLAPTMWSNFGEINLNDPRVKWYRYDSERKDVAISFEQWSQEIKK